MSSDEYSNWFEKEDSREESPEHLTGVIEPGCRARISGPAVGQCLRVSVDGVNFSLIRNKAGSRHNELIAMEDVTYSLIVYSFSGEEAYERLIPIPEYAGSSYSLDDLPISFIINADETLSLATDKYPIQYSFGVAEVPFNEGIVKVPTGESKFISGEINGNAVASFSVARLGRNASDIFIGDGSDDVNEDNCGFGKGRVVVADGMGGRPCGQEVSSFVVRSILNSDKELIDAVKDTFNAWEGYTFYFPIGKPDAVFMAAQFSSNSVDYAWTGDVQGIHVRDGVVLERTELRTCVRDAVRVGLVSEEDIYDHPKYKDNHHIVSTSVGSNIDTGTVDTVDTGSVDLVGSDMFLMLSDGLAFLTDEQIVSAVCGVSPGEGAKNLYTLVEKLNLDSIKTRTLINGKEVKIPPACDHGTAFIYQQQKVSVLETVANTLKGIRETLTDLF